MDHKRRHRHSLSREAAPLDDGAAPILHFSYASAGVPPPSQLIDSHQHSFPHRSMSYLASAAGNNAQYEVGLTNSGLARYYHGKSLGGGGGAQYLYKLEPQSRSETYPQGHHFLGPPVQQQQQFQQSGARQSFSPVDQLPYDALPASTGELGYTSSNESSQSQQRFSAPASPLDRPAHARRPCLSSWPSRDAPATSDRSQRQHQITSTTSSNGLNHPQPQYSQPQLHAIYNPFAAAQQQTLFTGLTPMARRRSVSAPPMGMPLAPPGASADLLGSRVQNLIDPNIYGLSQSISTPLRRSVIGNQTSRRELNRPLPLPTGLQSITSGRTFSTGAMMTSDLLAQTSMQMHHPRVQHLLMSEQPDKDAHALQQQEYSVSPPPRPASAPIMTPTPTHTASGFSDIYRQSSEICQLVAPEDRPLMPDEASQHHQRQQQQQQQQNLSSPQPQHHLPLINPTFKRTPRVHRCPKPFCMKTYKNPNGLKYHLDRGICEHFVNLDNGPATAAEDSTTRSFNTLEAAAAAGTVKIAHRPYRCKVPGCIKKYKNLNGLKYHAKAVHPTLDFLAEVKGANNAQA
ncbi:Transcriptional regulator of ribosomal biogenesis proteins [Geranomyces variabilis]|uniref:Transcriptional regulator of ribosomal biogenesis proteins n=1 Tax=Geranomyces variabilis TaxID=109894 RepID=A0AAD5TF02_9FUNG|nr:Transcriptional regulator of ribosomal biogenesis proteins [Geranomyces variabilis]